MIAPSATYGSHWWYGPNWKRLSFLPPYLNHTSAVIDRRARDERRCSPDDQPVGAEVQCVRRLKCHQQAGDRSGEGRGWSGSQRVSRGSPEKQKDQGKADRQRRGPNEPAFVKRRDDKDGDVIRRAMKRGIRVTLAERLHPEADQRARPEVIEGDGDALQAEVHRVRVRPQ